MTYELNVQISKHLLAPVAQPVATSLVEAALVQTLEGGRAALPVLPHVAAQALELANNPDSTVREFADLVMKDPPIAARFLATANSALYSRGQTIRSVSDAVARIGLAASRDLVFQVVYASTMNGMKHFQVEVQASFRRSVLCGIVCRAAAPVLTLEISDAYLCGLLHDIGEARVYRILDESKTVPSADEARMLVHKYHPRAGAELAMRWALPDDIVQVCRRHEEQGPAEGDRLRLVRLADLIVPCMEASPEQSTLPDLDKQLTEIGISVEKAQIVLERGLAAASRL
jgi:HD-like signal output (HDOD) protein